MRLPACISTSSGSVQGHEDLRQDERVMQLFGLVNSMLTGDRTTKEQDLSIARYAVIPLSPNSGAPQQLSWLWCHCGDCAAQEPSQVHACTAACTLTSLEVAGWQASERASERASKQASNPAA